MFLGEHWMDYEKSFQLQTCAKHKLELQPVGGANVITMLTYLVTETTPK